MGLLRIEDACLSGAWLRSGPDRKIHDIFGSPTAVLWSSCPIQVLCYLCRNEYIIEIDVLKYTIFRISATLPVLHHCALTYNGEVTKLTWPQVTNINNPKYTNCRHLRSYCAMRVSKSSDHWCALGTMSNFEKRNLRSGHLMRPGHVTFGVIGSSFFWKCVKLLDEQLLQI